MKNMNFDIYSIGLLQIQRFLTVAEFQNFTTAARKLNVEQPVISKNIAALEKSLNLILFTRDKGKVNLTPAGRYLSEQLRAIVPAIERSVEMAHVLQLGVMGQLTVGIHNFYDPSYFFMSVVNEFRQEFQHIKLYTKCYSFPGLRRRVLSGALDVAFTSRFESDDIKAHESDEFCVRELIEFPLTAVMLHANPLAKKDVITVPDLRYQRFIIHSPAKVPAYHKLIEDMCMKYDFVPLEYEYIEDATSFELSLSDNDQVFVVDRAARIDPCMPFKKYDLKGTVSGVSIIWKRNTTNSAVKLFVDSCEEFFLNHAEYNEKAIPSGLA